EFYETSMPLRTLKRFMSALSESIPRDIAHVFASRVARKWAGAALIVSFIGVWSGLSAEVYDHFGRGRQWWGCLLTGCDTSMGAFTTYAFLHSWVFAAVAFGIAYVAARRRLDARVATLNVPGLA